MDLRGVIPIRTRKLDKLTNFQNILLKTENIITYIFIAKNNLFNLILFRMIIPGIPTFAESVQGTIAHIIMLNFARRMKDTIGSKSEAIILLNLRVEIQLFHDQMKYPWGQICMLEKNALCVDSINQYYAIKSLANVVKIIKNENFVKLLRKTDQDFSDLWEKATSEVDKFYKDIKKLEILEYDRITASTVSLYNKSKGEENFLQESLIKAVNRVKMAWQTIWAKFKQTKKGFNYILSAKNLNFEIALSDIEPTVHNEIMIMLSCNDDNEIRLWARNNTQLFKSVVSKRPLKWMPTEKVFTTSKPTWWLYALKNFDLEQQNNYATISQALTQTTDY
jgi:hypothetical protein